MSRTISNITLDIETIAGTNKPRPEDISVPKNYKNPDAISKFQNDPKNLDAAWRKQALLPAEGRVHTIGWKIDADPAQALWHDGSDEEGLFKRWEASLVKTFKEHYGGEVIYGVTFVGFNIKLFDIVWLWLRARKFKCERLLKIIGQTPSDVRLEDVMRWMVFNSYRDFVSMDKSYRFFFGKSGKGDMDGSMVHDVWLSGQNEKISEYCIVDVEKTYELAVALGIIMPE